MASTYKYFSDHDRVVAHNNLTEVVENFSGSSQYAGSTAWLSESHEPKYFTQFATRYQDSTFWALATKTFDITFGHTAEVLGSLSSQDSAQVNIYNQFSKVLLGYDNYGNIQKFNLNPDYVMFDTQRLYNAVFINLKRSQFKDKVKQGSFRLHFDLGAGKRVILTDSGSNGPSVRECPAGYYGQLFVTGSNSADMAMFTLNSTVTAANYNMVQGLIFYEAGIAVISPYIFSTYNVANSNPTSNFSNVSSNKIGILAGAAPTLSGSYDIQGLLSASNNNSIAYGFATKLMTSSYHATTELNSAIYFCRAYNHEFNYSSNPTYLMESEIHVKGGDPEAQPLSYITTVGLYDDKNQLLAVAKLSEPIKKTPENELIARVRLDF